MTLLMDSNQLIHAYWHIKPDPDDVVERYLSRLTRIKQYFSRRIPDLQCVAVFDREGDSYRKIILPEYKSNRTRNESIQIAVNHAYEAVMASQGWMGIMAPECYEADDVIATLSAMCAQKGKVVIHSSDKDYRQCLKNGVVSLCTKSEVDEEGNLKLTYFTTESLVDGYGITPDRWVDYQCFVGDSSDNIKGADGIGHVGAKRLLEEHPGDIRSIDPSNHDWLSKRQVEGLEDMKRRLAILRCLLTLQTL